LEVVAWSCCCISSHILREVILACRAMVGRSRLLLAAGRAQNRSYHCTSCPPVAFVYTMFQGTGAVFVRRVAGVTQTPIHQSCLLRVLVLHAAVPAPVQ
jgi:hypothetical protein